LIFLGPKIASDSSIPKEKLKKLGAVDYPVFYLNYNLYPQSMPWRDVIGSVVKHWKGREFTITRPADLLSSWPEIMSRVTEHIQQRKNPNVTNPDVVGR
jgi:hypothetical protein